MTLRSAPPGNKHVNSKIRHPLIRCTPTLVAVLIAAALLSPVPADAGAPSALVAGAGFRISCLMEGAAAFTNRKYVWLDIPDSIRGWNYTMLAGGEPASVIVSVSADTVLYAASLNENDILEGWQPVPNASLCYSDAAKTRLPLYARRFNAGAIASVPEQGWSGVILIAPTLTNAQDLRPVPGVTVSHSPAGTGVYLGSPSIVIAPSGDYIASHDMFGPGSTRDEAQVFRSQDRGASWTRIADIHGIWWAVLFYHREALYLMGVDRENGHVVIRRSMDEGASWTAARDSRTGLLLADHAYCCGPGPAAVYNGRIWKAMEDYGPKNPAAKGYRAFVMSAPEDSDLLAASNWTVSNRLSYQTQWPGNNWLEGNMAVTPDNRLVDILRVDSQAGETAAMMHVSADGRAVQYDPVTDYLRFPGGGARFTIRYDPPTRRYWSLVDKQQNPRAYRNILALTSSPDLRNWTVDAIVLQDDDSVNVGFQYVDWQFDGDDIIALSRTAFDGAHSAHDANYITFHRIAGFRRLLKN